MDRIEVQFELTLERVLMPLVTCDEQLDTLKRNLSGPGWTALEDGLRERLPPRTSRTYLDIMTELKENMDEPEEAIGGTNAVFQEHVSRNGKVPNSSVRVQQPAQQPRSGRRSACKAGAEYGTKRVSFSLVEGKRERLFERLERLNDALDKSLIKKRRGKHTETVARKDAIVRHNGDSAELLV